ncbi:MAG: hypothetical protein WBI29_02705 [Candidatus Saccharimonadales bacterium]
MSDLRSNTLVNIYKRIVSDISSRHMDSIFEGSQTIEQCCIGVSRSTLENLPSEEFANAIYFKLLDRPASSADINRIASRLRSSQSTKKEEINKILKSQEYRIKNINVRMTK